ncbi:hypothetical protein HCZ22_00935 [Limosilactobacillus fermentum]
MKINVKEDLKELVNFESNKDDIKMVNAAGDVKEDKYDGPTYLAIFTWIYALCTSRYKTPRLFGEISKYTLYVWVVGLVLMFLLGSFGNGLATLLDIYFCVWCVISWRRLYVKVLTEEGYKPVATSTVSATSNTNSHPTAPHAHA